MTKFKHNITPEISKELFAAQKMKFSIKDLFSKSDQIRHIY